MANVTQRRPSPIPPQPHGLWSLWDMLELKAGAFVEAATSLAGTVSYIAGRSTADLPTESGGAGAFHDQAKLADEDRVFLKTRLTALSKHLDVLGADVTAVNIQDAEESLGHWWASWGTARQEFQEVQHTLKRELSLTTVLVLQAQETAYYEPKKPIFGKNFAEKFRTSGVFELDEAGKCFALGRPTACAFHLMRVMEIGIKALAASLQIPDPAKPAEKNWAVILRHIKQDGLDVRWPKSADRMSGDGFLFESLYASLDAVKNPWRNETMHPASKYTDDEARHIFVAVEGFMKKLSSRMDENGLPLA
jgi:hypothetical protein